MYLCTIQTQLDDVGGTVISIVSGKRNVSVISGNPGLFQDIALTEGHAFDYLPRIALN